MDAERFDDLVESLTRSGSRRGVLRTLTGAVLGAVGLGAVAEADAAKSKRRGDRKGKTGRRKNRVRAQAASCCSGGNCSPGAGKNLGKCCYEGQNLAGKNFKGANLGSANFSGATLTNANFTSANLDKTCFVDADVTGAKFTAANTASAIFCRTQTSQGINNSGCGKGTNCCETCNREIGQICAGAGDICCDGATCCADGCRDLSSDENNCGECGNVCGSGLTCCGGECVNLLTDLDNCTACGNACPASLPKATVICGEGQDEQGRPGYGCAFVCNTGFANCSGDPLTGCEQSVSSNPSNCGACGFSCPASKPRCCGCDCFEACDPTVEQCFCSICQPVTTARLIRRR